MLNSKKLTELLTENEHPQFYPRMFIMSPNGTLIAYRKQADVKMLRDQAALISLAWKEEDMKLKMEHSEATTEQEPTNEPVLQTLTIESENNNILVRAIQPNLLLVVIGGVPPSRKVGFKITPETVGGQRYPSPALPDNVSTPSPERVPPQGGSPRGGYSASTSSPKAASVMSDREKDMKLGLLHIQRKKLDAISDYIKNEFDKAHFVMPEESFR
ncbi:hypothetical protein M501DRAFT_937626 [Patellaria atrata CBS 101060]|uniref:Uncharacterized protein n=1 Tax=Patellaria atrata CBS 101060 TaxID=1346257 RepID=A0A9P4S7Q2_9PEZI|nr:hypothetical protein M501DRAFT_937626 [Patellaria atrata CBS 101060]